MIHEAIQNLRPNSNFFINYNSDNTYKVVFNDTTIVPTKNEIKDEILRIKNKKETALKKQDIYNKLDKLDLKSIRAIRENNQDLINSYENEAIALRNELSLLNA